MIIERPAFFTDEVERAFIREFSRSPSDIISVAERALVGTPQANQYGCAINIRDFYDNNVDLRNKCVDRIEGIQPEDDEPGMPTQEEFALELLKLARNEKNRAKASAADKEFALRCYRLVAEIQGFTGKSGGNTNIQLNVHNQTNKVMIIPPEETLEQWQERTRTQQVKLIEEARVPDRPTT